MNSWYQAMLLNMARGQHLHLSRRDYTLYDWVMLWSLMEEQVRVMK